MTFTGSLTFFTKVLTNVTSFVVRKKGKKNSEGKCLPKEENIDNSRGVIKNCTGFKKTW
jgi:hypothetical protein